MSTTSSPPIPVETYNLDPIHSTFGFSVRHNGVSTFRGHFEQVEVQLSDGVLTGTAQVESFKTSLPFFYSEIMGPQFFNAAETPTVTFRSTDIRVDDGGTAEVDGDLTIRGVTRPVTATGTFATGSGMQGEVAGLDLEATIDRRDFGFDWQVPLPSDRFVLGWDVTLEVHVELGRSAE